MARKEIVPTYIQDLENCQFAVVSENDEDGSYFGRYINTKTGNADASRGSIRFEKDDPHVKWLIDLMVRNNLGENEEGKFTSHLLIQQVTKGGNFVGSNKLKHNTTGMVELRYTGSGERKINITKNRRGFEYQDLVFDIPEEGGITFDVARLERERNWKKESIRKETNYLPTKEDLTKSSD